MKKLIYLIVLMILCGYPAAELRAQTLRVGAEFPVDKLSPEKKAADATIIVFMPSVTYDCDYASMLTRSFYYYFDQKLAFEGLKKNPATRIFLVVGDKIDLLKSAQNRFGAMNVIYDEKGELFAAFGVNPPTGKNADSTVVLLDAGQRIVHIDEHYRAQGEHLKPLENKLKELSGIYRKPVSATLPSPLKVGDQAPDFRVNEKQRLADLRGKVVLVSFYPAAFSGTLPKPEYFSSASSSNDSKTLPLELFLKSKDSSADLTSVSGSNVMSCFRQVSLLDVSPTALAESTKRIAISSSTNALLTKWQELLNTKNVEYTNDADYSIATKYFSYNPEGYANRVSVIVDQKGRIAYIDESFESGDEAVLNAKIDELLRKGA